MSRMYIDSDTSMPSLIQSCGYTAAIAAPMSPARSPEILRPTSPTTTTAAAPSRHDASRCARAEVNPSHENTARYIE